ncbi:MAG: ACP phosphodiesterase [Ruminococcaceae bacterium]|nr:ACP phosphodiesterase [Oscillospiraceae bacterium]
MVLFINGCVRAESRTLELAKAVLSKEAGQVQEVKLYPDGPEGLNEETLRQRDELLRKGEYSHPMFRWANQFARADTIVIAAPYWDLMFPAKVRAYLEEITVTGITFQYSADGIPQGLCKAKRLIYVTTAGGPIIHNFGFDYVKALAQSFYGIFDVRLVKAEGLNIWGADVDAIMEEAKRGIPRDVD